MKLNTQVDRYPIETKANNGEARKVYLGGELEVVPHPRASVDQFLEKTPQFLCPSLPLR